MSERDRLGDFALYVILVLGLLFVAMVAWFVFYSKGYQAANQRYLSQYANFSTYDKVRDRCLNLPTTSEIRECFSATQTTYREDYRAEQDLNAQKEMADWAERTLLATIATTLLTALGLWWVRGTLIETRRGVFVAREIGEAQVRAYISVESATITLVGGRTITLGITCKNTGLSPARFVTVSALIIARGHSQDRHKPGHIEQFSAGHYEIGTIHSACFGLIDNIAFKDPDLCEEQWGKRAIGLEMLTAEIVIFAIDVFGKEIRTEFIARFISGSQLMAGDPVALHVDSFRFPQIESLDAVVARHRLISHRTRYGDTQLADRNAT